MNRILVADDDDLLVELMRLTLEQRGHQVYVAPDGAAAVRMAEAHRPDVVVLDLMMPGIDGFEVLRRFQSRVDTQDIPTLVLSARKWERDMERARSLGARDYLVKPFIPDDLLLRIDNLAAQQAGSTRRSCSAGDGGGGLLANESVPRRTRSTSDSRSKRNRARR
jgi:DNA-binding response OmpR family regulator